MACAILVAGCATNANAPQGQASNPLRNLFAGDDPCSNNARNIGIAGGVLAGLLVGNAIGNGKSDSLAAGALVGGLLGGFIGADMDRKRCELAKVAKKYDLEISFTPIVANEEATPSASTPAKVTEATPTAQTTLGSALTVRDKGGSVGHFESGSDQLTPKAREYFAAIAAQYGSEKMLEGQTSEKHRDEIRKQTGQRRIFLMGHTDDTGSTTLNATLSERRAKAVASYLKQQGIAEDSLYFQGAGETLPLADNRTEAGRAENRRVEIIEIADEASFKKYLDARKPKYEFYRTQRTETIAGATSVLPASKPANAVAAKPTTTPTILATAPAINFAGVPYSPSNATIATGAMVPEKSRFSLLPSAYASDTVVANDCTQDRPRSAGAVKSLKDGATYKTNEHIPQLYGKTWAGNVNGNLVVINHLRVLRDGGTPANLPELKVYAQYKPESGRKPEINEEPLVNSYLVGQGVLYRMYPRADSGLKCVDLLFATDGATTARAGKVIYAAGTSNLVADFRPQMQ